MNSLLLEQGVVVSIALAVAGLVIAVLLIRQIVAADAGNERMSLIGGAIQEGAKAYLNRQIRAVGLIAIVLFFVVWYARDGMTSAGFVVGAVCSMVAGYIGMMIAVRANVRTAQAASKDSHGALKMAFNGGAVTGLLVVALGLLSVGVFYLIVEKMAGVRAAIRGDQVVVGAQMVGQPDRVGDYAVDKDDCAHGEAWILVGSGLSVGRSGRLRQRRARQRCRP